MNPKFRYTFLSAVIFLLLQSFSSCAFSQDLSTNEKVLEVLNQGRERKWKKESVCIERPNQLKGIIIVGFFAHDRGCRFNLAFVNGKKYEGIENATKASLNHLGWTKKQNEERLVLAMNWTKYSLLQFHTALEKATPDFNLSNTPTFSAPQSTLNDDGSIKITIWVRQPSGMLPQRDYDLMEYRFGDDGSLKEYKSIKSFTRKIQRE